jgi:hypothetical protein
LNYRTRQLGLLLAAACVATSCGCRWNPFLRRHVTEPPPIAFVSLPSPEEAVAAINANTQRVRSLQTQGATVSIPGFPSIGAEIHVERPQRLRFRATSQLLGPHLDLGNNEQLFWVWSPAMPQSAVLFARHDQFAQSRAREMFPIEPGWLIQGLGLVEIEPASVLEGPFADGGERVRLRTTVPSAVGQFTRLLILHSKYGWVLEQHVYDERNQLVASSRTSGHEYSPVDGVSLPKRIEVQMPHGELRFQLDIDRWATNLPAVEGPSQFDLPREKLAGYPFIDLADPSFVPPPGISGQPRDGRLSQQPDHRPRVRGWR